MRNLVHSIAAVLSWLAFGFYWWLVAQRRLNPSTIRSVTILLAIVGATCLFTVVWVFHNRRLARRHGTRRRARPVVAPLPSTDFLGRTLQQRGGSPLFMAPYTEVDVQGDVKLFVTSTSPPAGPPDLPGQRQAGA